MLQAEKRAYIYERHLSECCLKYADILERQFDSLRNKNIDDFLLQSEAGKNVAGEIISFSRALKTFGGSLDETVKNECGEKIVRNRAVIIKLMEETKNRINKITSLLGGRNIHSDTAPVILDVLV